MYKLSQSYVIFGSYVSRLRVYNMMNKTYCLKMKFILEFTNHILVTKQEIEVINENDIKEGHRTLL